MRRPFATDLAIAVVVCVVALVTTRGVPAGGLVPAAVACGALVARRRTPFTVFLVSSVAAEVYLVVRTKPYGSEGTEPVDLAECPYYQQYRVETSCVSGSGGSMCGGFFGGSEDYVKCAWVPRVMLPGQRFVVEPRHPADDPDPSRRQAGCN